MEVEVGQNALLYLRKDRSRFFPLTFPRLPGDKPSSSCSHFPAPSSAASRCCVILTLVGEQHAGKSWSLGQNNAAFAVSAFPRALKVHLGACLHRPQRFLKPQLKLVQEISTELQYRNCFVLEVSCLLIYFLFEDSLNII